MENALMAPRKNKINRNPAAEAVAKAIIENYKPETVEDMQLAIKDIFDRVPDEMDYASLNNCILKDRLSSLFKS